MYKYDIDIQMLATVRHWDQEDKNYSMNSVIIFLDTNNYNIFVIMSVLHKLQK